jgi:V/A-type H+-transporting ATPase subunit C
MSRIGSRGGAPLLEFRPLVYGYSNARVRAMRPMLLNRRQAEDLIKVRTNAGVEEYLSRTPYKPDFASMPHGVTEKERVEIAVSRNFARTARKLIGLTPERSLPTLLAFLGRYDVHNIKTVLLAKKLGRSAGHAMNLLIPAGSISPAELSAMIAAKSADELYGAMRATDFGSKLFASASLRHVPREQLKAAFASPQSDSAKLDVFLTSLDFYYYEMASNVSPGEKDGELLAGLLRSEADAKNITTAMRLKRTGADAATIMKYMVEGGELPKPMLEKIAKAKELHEQVRLASSFFISKTGREEFAEAEKRYKADGQLSHFEVVFEKSLARRSLQALHRSMMSIGAIVGFLLLKEVEMDNIEKIVNGKALGVPPERVADMLVLVG